MDDSSKGAFANRDEAIPVIRIPSRTDGPSSAASEDGEKQRTRDKIKDSANKLKGKLEEYSTGTPETRQSIQDRFFNGLMSQVIPPEELDSSDDDNANTRDSLRSPSKKPDRRSRQYVDRPGFSLPLMSANFRRFNARIGVAFVLQNRLIHLFTWHQPTATLSFLAVYSLLCLQPHLLPLLPLLALLFTIMIPSFLARHPAPKNDPRVEPSFRGPPLAPASRVKPAPEMSKDFFRNMRDLQNSMDDFSTLHDAANDYITPYTNFSDEGVSSLLFVSFFVLSCAAFVGAQLVPWRAVALIGGWTATAFGHPEAQKIMLSDDLLSQLRQHLELALQKFRAVIEQDILLDSPPDRREVEVFELQKFHIYNSTWEPWLFSPSPYDPLSPPRIAGARAKGTQFFEDVAAPKGWVWRGKKWMLDLASREWVEQRMITGVEIETEGERWVYDLPDEVVTETLGSPKAKAMKKKGPRSGWAEGGADIGRGEWRRRRWVRLVERNVEWEGQRKKKV
ncbi:Peroxisome size and maintenance regulator [Teratosphaeriaceae sp. CCFEE 6253]|nr:Peroxisome size and maintenance regulator [Teratosphaeriaceae sp. CCFEE 6253]